MVEVQPRRVEPQAHRVAALAEDAHVVDAADALEDVDDVVGRVVADEDAVVARVGRREAHREDERAAVLGHGHAGRAHLGGEPADRVVDLVLHVVGGEVDVAVELERADDRAGAVAGGRRGDVAQAVDAVDRLFERRGDGRLRGLRVRAGVGRGHGDDRRRDLRKLGDGQGRDRDQPGQHDEERADRREHRPVQEELDHGTALRPRRAPNRCRTRRRCSPCAEPRRWSSRS